MLASIVFSLAQGQNPAQPAAPAKAPPRLAVDEIASAGKVAGLTFTETELKQMQAA